MTEIKNKGSEKGGVEEDSVERQRLQKKNIGYL